MIAFILMIIAVFGQIWNLTIIWDNITIGTKVSSIAGGVLFNLLLALLFIGLWKMTPKVNGGMTLSSSEIITDNKDLDMLLKSMSEENKPKKRAKHDD